MPKHETEFHFHLFNDGLRQMGLPNEFAVYITYLVEAGLKNPELEVRIGTYGVEQAYRALRNVQMRGCGA